MTPDLLATLHPPRLPEAFAALGWDDVLAAVGLGLVLAGIALTVLAPMLRPRARRVTPAQAIAAASALPPPERMLALTRLLVERGGSLPDDLRSALYAGTPADPARIEALILQAGRR